MLSELDIQNIVQRAETSIAENDKDALKRILAQIAAHRHKDPRLIFIGAKSAFWFGDAQLAKSQFEELIALFPDFRSPEGHLYYCQCLELTGEFEKAVEEYAQLAVYYPGAQVKVRYALLLAKMGHTERAQSIAMNVIQQANIADAQVRESQELWLQQAKMLIVDLSE